MEPNGYRDTGNLDRTFAALADPTRRAILHRLAQGEAAVVDLAAPFGISQPAVSRHLRVLERAGIITAARDAQRRPRRLTAAPLADASQWLDQYRQFWERSFERLDDVLEELKARGRPGAQRPRKQRRPTPRKGTHRHGHDE